MEIIFPDKNHWVVRGRYRTGGLRGRSCSVSVYCRLADPNKVLARARTENPWMVPEAAHLVRTAL